MCYDDVISYIDVLIFMRDDKLTMNRIRHSDLKKNFSSMRHKANETYQFHLQKEEKSENIETYIAILRQLAKKTATWDY